MSSRRRLTAAATLVLVAGAFDLAAPDTLASQPVQVCGVCRPVSEMYLCESAPEQHFAAACLVACGELPNGFSIACVEQLEGMECGAGNIIVNCRAYET